ncbi:MAG: DUF2213 domain-containing protein [Planctomycetota bacterium]|jgi:hypothetical protein
MKRSQIRIDRSLPLKSPKKTSEGYLYAEAFATRAGVFPYRREDGSIVHELRHPDEVGDPKSIASLGRKPITDEHPTVFVDAENFEEQSKGLVDGNVEWVKDFDDGYVKVTCTISSKELVDKIESGKVEVSCGYTADIIDESGEWTDASGKVHRYDSVQKNIRYNHLAVVDKGRAGRLAKIKTDAAVQVVDSTMRKNMSTIRVDGQEVPVSDYSALKAAIDSLQKRKDEAEAEAEKTDKKVEDMKREYEDMKAKAEDMESKLEELMKAKNTLEAEIKKMEGEAEGKMDSADFEKAVAERIELLEVAKKFEVKLDAQTSNEEIMKAVALTRYDSIEGLDLRTAYSLATRYEPTKKSVADSISNRFDSSETSESVSLENNYINKLRGSK